MKKYILLMLGLISLDAVTKYWAENYLQKSIEIIPGFFSLHYIQNIGIAFSIPLTGILLKIVTVILIFGIFWYYWKQEKHKESSILHLSYAFIFAGALGNAWERIFKSYVTDFLAVEHFSVFNLADSYITLGALGIMYYYWKIEPHNQLKTDDSHKNIKRAI